MMLSRYIGFGWFRTGSVYDADGVRPFACLKAAAVRPLRRSVVLFLLGLLVLSASACSDKPTPTAENQNERPNVVLIILDSLRAEAMSLYGNEVPNTPYLNALADDSVVFDRCTSNAHWTRVSMPCIFTGLYPNSHGQFSLADRAGALNDVIPDSAFVMADAFREDGYKTAAMSTMAWYGRHYGFAQGFEDVVRQEDLEAYRAENGADPAKELYGLCMHRNDGATVDLAIDWMRKARTSAKPETPVFMLLHFYGVHGPLNLEEQYRDFLVGADRYDFYQEKMGGSFGLDKERSQVQEARDNPEFRQFCYDLYRTHVKACDDYMRTLIETLREIDENTLFIITADHGELFMEKPSEWQHGGNMSPYEELIHVPLMFYWPGHTQGSRVHERVVHVDLLPTLADLLEFDVPGQLDGESFAGYIEDSLGKPEPDRFLLSMEAYEFLNTSLIHDNLKFLRRFPNSINAGWRLGRTNGAEALYDLGKDPNEADNLIGRRAGIAREMRAELNESLLKTRGVHCVFVGDGQLRDIDFEIVSDVTPTRYSGRVWHDEGFDPVYCLSDQHNLAAQLTAPDGTVTLDPGEEKHLVFEIPRFPSPADEGNGTVSLGFHTSLPQGAPVRLAVTGLGPTVTDDLTGAPGHDYSFYRDYLVKSDSVLDVLIANNREDFPLVLKDLFVVPTQGSFSQIWQDGQILHLNTALGSGWLDINAAIPETVDESRFNLVQGNFDVYYWAEDDFHPGSLSIAFQSGSTYEDLIIRADLNVAQAIRDTLTDRPGLFLYRCSRLEDTYSNGITRKDIEDLRKLGYLK